MQCWQVSFSSNFSPQLQIYPLNLAGLPNQSVLLGISQVTTEPAPIIAYLPMVFPATIVAFAPIDDHSSKAVFKNTSGYCFDLGLKSLVNVTLGPINTLSLTLTPSQMYTPDFTVTLFPKTTSFSIKVWSLILQLDPIVAPGKTCANAHIRVSSPIWSVSTIACG
ncbi:hypothetical protein D3C78_1448830 [compost metagenome]